MKKAGASLTGLGTMAELLPISNQEVKATSTRDGPKREHKAQHKPVRSKRRKEMNVMTEVLIEDCMKVRKLPRPTEVGVVGAAKIRAIGIVGFAVALDSSSMSMTVRQEQHRE